MNLVLVTAPAIEPVTVAEAKAHALVATSAHDTLIGGYIAAARRLAEQQTRRAFITQTWRMSLDDFPDGNLVLPRPPLAELQQIDYYDPSDELVSYDTDTLSDFVNADYDAEPAIVYPIAGYWPATSGDPGRVKITYSCGYGAEASSVPESVKLAIKQTVAHWYEHRESVIAGMMATEMPQSAAVLLDDVRIWEQW